VWTCYCLSLSKDLFHAYRAWLELSTIFNSLKYTNIGCWEKGEGASLEFELFFHLLRPMLVSISLLFNSFSILSHFSSFLIFLFLLLQSHFLCNFWNGLWFLSEWERENKEKNLPNHSSCLVLLLIWFLFLRGLIWFE
jgi:hypothetical protein